VKTGAGTPRRGVRFRTEALRAARDASDAWAILRDPTYRRLAASYELPDGSKRVYCYHVRKTAGTSLYLSFLALGGEDPVEVWRRITKARLPRTVSGGYVFAANSRRLLAEGAYFFGRSHHSADRQPLPPRTFTVTVLRDPVDRVRSLYDYLVAGDPPETPGRAGDLQRGWAADGFDRFLERIPSRHLLNQVATFSSRFDVSEAADRIAGCSSVLFTKNFDEGLRELGHRLELPLEVRRARVGTVRSPLSDAQENRLRARLEPEFELLRRLEEGGLSGV
jgi:hypothetical protein